MSPEDEIEKPLPQFKEIDLPEFAPTFIDKVQDKTNRASISAVVRIIANAVNNGEITLSQAQELRARLGITNAYFTKKKRDKIKIKAKRKMARRARRINRLNNSTKGQKMTGGVR